MAPAISPILDALPRVEVPSRAMTELEIDKADAAWEDSSAVQMAPAISPILDALPRVEVPSRAMTELEIFKADAALEDNTAVEMAPAIAPILDAAPQTVEVPRLPMTQLEPDAAAWEEETAFRPAPAIEPILDAAPRTAEVLAPVNTEGPKVETARAHLTIIPADAKSQIDAALEPTITVGQPSLASALGAPNVSSTPQCTADLNAPFEMRQALANYRASADFDACNKAAAVLVSRQAGLGKQANILWNRMIVRKQVDILDIVSNYANACLKKFSDADLKGLLTRQQRSAILDSVGVISSPTGEICVGMLYGSHVVTARHCFADLTPARWGQINKVPDNLKFTSFNQRGYSLSVTRSARTAFFKALSADALDRDFTFLEAEPFDKAAAVGKLIKQSKGMAKQWQRIMLVSLQPYLKAIDERTSPSALDPSIDISPTCAVLVKDGNFLLHGCQTEAGMSGTPMLAIDDNNNVVIIGLHTGETANIKGPCEEKYAESFPNYGIALPDLEELLK
ncbi:MAG: hypothetical protein EOR95_33505 [Mesorhizobium sp.]|nr:MAG: hypothetical protein EOR95_33505 [Mesorhizobium sp.]